MKKCKVCWEEKPMNEYYTKKESIDGHYHTCKACYKERVNKRWCKERQRDYDLKRKYGISAEEYDMLLDTQDNRCAICRKEWTEDTKRFAVDHNHDTGEVRGILCHGCNAGIGNLQDSARILRAAADYLEERGSYG